MKTILAWLTSSACTHNCRSGRACTCSTAKGCAITGALVLAIAGVLAWGGPALDDNSGEFAQAANIEDAIKAEQAQARFEKAARDVCGENSGWRLTNNDREVQCYTHRGYRTIVARVAP